MTIDLYTSQINFVRLTQWAIRVHKEIARRCSGVKFEEYTPNQWRFRIGTSPGNFDIKIADTSADLIKSARRFHKFLRDDFNDKHIEVLQNLADTLRLKSELDNSE